MTESALSKAPGDGPDGLDNPVPTWSFVLFQGLSGTITFPLSTCGQSVTISQNSDTEGHKSGFFRAVPTAPTGGGLTLEDYNKLMTGMTEAEVSAITGPCETSSETSIGGSTSKTLTCKGSEPFSNATLIFSNGKLASKSQFGLGGNSPTEAKGAMTLAKYNQLTIGQTSAEVQSITGPCEKSSETSIAGHESFALTCYASDGLGNALLLFSGDKLQSKSQFDLH